MYLNVFKMYFDVFWYIYIIFMYLNIFVVYFNVFIMYLNIFSDIVIDILLSHSRYNVSAMRTHLYICFSLSTMNPFPICTTTTLFSHVSIDLFNKLFHIPLCSINYSTFHIVISCTEHHRSPNILLKYFYFNIEDMILQHNYFFYRKHT
jgi:hypothetical protein